MLPRPARHRRRRSPARAAVTEVQAAALALLQARLADHGFSLDPGEGNALRLVRPDGAIAGLNGWPRRRSTGAAATGAAATGAGDCTGCSTSDGEDYVALVDLSREAVWLMPAVDFRNRDQPLPGGRFHLDWLVWRLSPRSQVEDEEAFEEYRLG